MASGKEIRTQIQSIKNTQKITSAMHMVAASKMRKARERMAAGRPYADRIRLVIGHLANASSEYRHRYMQPREVKRVGYIVVSTDKGLCGGLNANLFRGMVPHMEEFAKQEIGIDLCLIGAKAGAFFRSFGGNVKAATTQLGDKPSVADLIGSIKVMLDAFDNGEIDQLFLVSNRFVNTMTQSPEIKQLLPLTAEDSEQYKHRWDYIYEPDGRELLDELLARYIESLVYQAVVENNACEQSAKMVAMKSATDNAGGLIDDLELSYNKARQAAITQELSEIVGGAAAV